MRIPASSLAAALAVAVSMCCASREESYKVFEGVEAGQHEFPMQVYISSTIFDHDLQIHYKLFCGGIIISEKWIVTAAHCLNSSVNMLVGYGSAIRKDMKYTAGQRMIAHENYTLYGRNNNNAINDIGLIELWEPLELNRVTVAAALLPAFLQPVHSNKETIVIGWGRWTYNQTQPSRHIASVLQKLNVEVIPCPDGNNNVICVQSEVGKGICDGDSGGPVLIDGIVFGVASYVDNIDTDPLMDPNDHCNEAGTWAVYTSISAFREWIKDISGV